MFGFAVIEGPVALVAEGGEGAMAGLGAGGFGEGDGVVGAAGIDDVDVIAPGDGLETSREDVLFVEGEDDDADVHGWSGGPTVWRDGRR